MKTKIIEFIEDNIDDKIEDLEIEKNDINEDIQNCKIADILNMSSQKLKLIDDYINFLKDIRNYILSKYFKGE